MNEFNTVIRAGPDIAKSTPLASSATYSPGGATTELERVAEPRRWSLPTRVAFRFAFLWLLLLIFPFPFEREDSPDVLTWLWHPIIPWVGMHILRLSKAPLIVPGDGEYFLLLRLLTYTAIAAVITAVWSVADRKRLAYPRLHDRMYTYVRIYLAAVMFEYGASKLFPYQFRPPSLARLVQPLGDYEPIGLLWAFIGSSKLYTFFSGAVEATAALLLFIPRTATAGALLTLAALTNVFVLDVSYDVSIRTFAATLMLVCLFLLAPEARRLGDVFILNRSASPAPSRELFRHRRLSQGFALLQVVFASWIVYVNLAENYRDARFRDAALRNNPLRGVWRVDDFQVNGLVRPPLTTDPDRWQAIIIDSPPGFSSGIPECDGCTDLWTMQATDGSLHRFRLTLDLPKASLVLGKLEKDPNWQAHLRIVQRSQNEIVLEGEYERQHVYARLHLTRPQFKLTTYKSHWPDHRALNPFVGTPFFP